MTGHLIVDAVRAARPEDTVVWCPTRAELVTHLTGHLTPGDLCLTLGAGDLTTLPDELIEVLGRPDVDAALAARFGDRLERDRSLAPMCTYRVGGAARWFLTADSVEDLTAIASVAGSHRLPTLVVGRGSNLLVADGGFEGLAIALSGVFDTISVDAGRRLPGEVVEVTAGAAVSLPVLARRCVTEGLGGLEWAVIRTSCLRQSKVGVGRWGPRFGRRGRAHERRGPRFGHGRVVARGPRHRPADRR